MKKLLTIFERFYKCRCFHCQSFIAIFRSCTILGVTETQLLWSRYTVWKAEWGRSGLDGRAPCKLWWNFQGKLQMHRRCKTLTGIPDVDNLTNNYNRQFLIQENRELIYLYKCWGQNNNLWKNHIP